LHIEIFLSIWFQNTSPKYENDKKRSYFQINIQIQVWASSGMKAKTVIYSAYLALKLWFYRKIKGRKSRPEREISM
jgi:hypothetical protein